MSNWIDFDTLMLELDHPNPTEMNELHRLKAQLAILNDVLEEYDGYRTLTNVIQNIEARLKKLESYGNETHNG